MNAAASRSERRAYIARLRLEKTLWIGLFVLTVLFPVIVAAIGNTLSGTWRSIPREIGSFAGLIGLSLMILSFIPITRDPFITKSFNLDEIYKFHKKYSTCGFGFAAVHLAILWAQNPEVGKFLNIFSHYPFYTIAGALALIASGAIVYFSFFRKELKVNYDLWKVGHSLFAILMVVMGMLHMFGYEYYSGQTIIKIYYWALIVLSSLSVLWLRIIVSTKECLTPYKIVEKHIRNNATTEIVLEYAGSAKHHPCAYHTGQIAWITVRRNPFCFRKHPFSITSSDKNQNRISFAIRELGDFTSTIKNLEIGEKVYVEGGFGTFDISKLGDEGFVMIAGGIGIAPAMGILRTMATRKDKRHVVLFYGSRDFESIGFYEDLETLKTKINLDVVHVLERTEDPAFEKGYITKEVLERHYPQNRDRYDVFICGPAPMLRLVLPALKALGIKKDNLWPEYYDMA